MDPIQLNADEVLASSILKSVEEKLQALNYLGQLPPDDPCAKYRFDCKDNEWCIKYKSILPYATLLVDMIKERAVLKSVYGLYVAIVLKRVSDNSNDYEKVIKFTSSYRSKTWVSRIVTREEELLEEAERKKQGDESARQTLKEELKAEILNELNGKSEVKEVEALFQRLKDKLQTLGYLGTLFPNSALDVIQGTLPVHILLHKDSSYESSIYVTVLVESIQKRASLNSVHDLSLYTQNVSTNDPFNPDKVTRTVTLTCSYRKRGQSRVRNL